MANTTTRQQLQQQQETEQLGRTMDHSQSVEDHLGNSEDSEGRGRERRSASSWLKENGAQVTACISNFSTSYNVVNISLVLPILELLHPDVTSEDAAVCASSLLAGMMVGQVIGGALGDTVWLGRLGALRVVMALQVVASLASASIGILFGPVRDIFMWLAVWRFVLGVGCGGVYPLAAVLSAEQSAASTTASTRREETIDETAVAATTTTDTEADGIMIQEEMNEEITEHDHNHHETHPSEEDTSKSVHRVVLTFSTQGLGFISVPIVAVLLLFCTTNLNLIWRIMLGLGALPGLFLMIFQGYCFGGSGQRTYAGISQQVPVEDAWQIDYNLDDNDDDNNDRDDDGEVDTGIRHRRRSIDETVENDSVLASDFDESDIEQRNMIEDDGHIHDGGHEGQHVSSPSSPAVATSLFHEPRLGRKIVGTAGTWFLFDVVFYGNTIFQPIVVEAAFGASSSNDPIHLLRKTAIDSLILTGLALPGYAVSGIIMGKKTGCITQTPRYVMLQGFACMSVLYFTIGMNWSYLRGYPAILVVLYGGTFFFANYGPNTTTFILPSLLFEKEHRATWNGIAAATGKLGALTGATLFAPAADAFGDNIVMLICSGVAVLAYILTFLFVPRQQDTV